MSAEHHGHVHDDHDVSQHDPEAAERNKVPYYGKRLYAIRDLLLEKGVLSRAEIQRQIEYMDARSPANGARLVARAWVDPAFKQRLLSDPKAACAELGIDARALTELVVLENTEQVHNLVVCTLCSCYPRAVLGRPPDWYKSFAYRSRAVVEPRAVMSEFGTTLPDDVEVRVFDSSADIRYLVLPRRPEGTEGMTEEQLAELVTRDSMIGVTLARQPSPRPLPEGEGVLIAPLPEGKRVLTGPLPEGEGVLTPPVPEGKRVLTGPLPEGEGVLTGRR